MFDAPLEGRYAIRRELGAGGHGRVFLAEDLKLGRAVAVKVLGPVSQGTENEVLQRFEREGRVSSAINHPNVCAVSDIGRLPNGLPFLVMELLTGETLAQRIEHGGKLPLDNALHFAEQILLGLAAAHRIGIVHRDIKPLNMFLVHLGHGREQLKLLDFGTAQVPGGPPSDGATLTRAGFVMGTMDYMAPEQVRGLRAFDARTDVYAVGVVLHEMLTGYRPFHGLALDALCEAIAFKQPPRIASVAPHLPRPIARAIDLALSIDVKRRPNDAGAFLSVLRASTAEVDEWDIATHQATPIGKAAERIGIEAGEWDLVTHRMGAPVGAAGTSSIEVTFGPTGEERVAERQGPETGSDGRPTRRRG